MQVMSSQDSQETIVYPMEQDEEEELAPHSPPSPTTTTQPSIPPGDGKGGAEGEVQREHPQPGDALSKKNGPHPPPPLLAGAAGAGQ